MHVWHVCGSKPASCCRQVSPAWRVPHLTAVMTGLCLSVQVIYGDTDSIMVATGAAELKDVGALGGRIKREVNKRYRLLEIEEDGLFKRMLMLKKKKYAALKLTRNPDGSWAEVSFSRKFSLLTSWGRKHWVKVIRSYMACSPRPSQYNNC